MNTSERAEHRGPLCPDCGVEMHNATPDEPEHELWYCPKQKASLDASGQPARGHVSKSLALWDDHRLDAWHSPV